MSHDKDYVEFLEGLGDKKLPAKSTSKKIPKGPPKSTPEQIELALAHARALEGASEQLEAAVPLPEADHTPTPDELARKERRRKLAQDRRQLLRESHARMKAAKAAQEPMVDSSKVFFNNEERKRLEVHQAIDDLIRRRTG